MFFFYIFLPPTNFFFFFFFNDTATTEIYTLSLHDALPISQRTDPLPLSQTSHAAVSPAPAKQRSEEHTSELQSLTNLVCRLLLEKKKKKIKSAHFLMSRVWSREDREFCSSGL